jgi:hypothetical protein
MNTDLGLCFRLTKRETASAKLAIVHFLTEARETRQGLGSNQGAQMGPCLIIGGFAVSLGHPFRGVLPVTRKLTFDRPRKSGACLQFLENRNDRTVLH